MKKEGKNNKKIEISSILYHDIEIYIMNFWMDAVYEIEFYSFFICLSLLLQDAGQNVFECNELLYIEKGMLQDNELIKWKVRALKGWMDGKRKLS